MTVTGLILAGGRAERMNGQDKGLISLEGRSLIEHTLSRFSPQVDTLFISANRNIDHYRQFGYKVLEDSYGNSESRNFEGPLAGLQRLFEETTQSPVVLVPCDAPLLSRQLVRKLLDAYDQNKQLAVIPHDGKRMQPLFGLYAPETINSLNDYLKSGQRKVITWVESLSPQFINFPDQVESFLNINTPDDLARAKELLTASKNKDRNY